MNSKDLTNYFNSNSGLSNEDIDYAKNSLKIEYSKNSLKIAYQFLHSAGRPVTKNR